MSEEGFEKGLKLLLNQAYHKPEAREDFRNELLERLRHKQRERRSVRRNRVIALFGTVSAAAAMVAITFLPVASPDISAPAQPASPASIALIEATGGNSGKTAPLMSPLDSPREARVLQTSTSLSESLSGLQAHAVNAVDVRANGTKQWTRVAAGQDFKLEDGMRLRTPVGAVEPVSVALGSGALVMLDGMSQLEVSDKSLRLLDGRAVVSLSNSREPLMLRLGGQEMALQAGSMVFARAEDGEEFAANGAPAPVMVLLKGQAEPVGENAQPLMAGRVYELFDTGTGRYPSRELGSYETERRFIPMINAIQAANEYH